MDKGKLKKIVKEILMNKELTISPECFLITNDTLDNFVSKVTAVYQSEMSEKCNNCGTRRDALDAHNYGGY